MATKETIPPDTYLAFLGDLKERIRSARLHAALAVNRELVLLYWSIGKDILERQQSEGWGSKVVDRLARDLHHAFPEMTGLSPRNLKYMRTFAEAYPDREFVQHVVAQLPWGHNVRLLDAVKQPAERAWYARQAIEPPAMGPLPYDVASGVVSSNQTIRNRTTCLRAPHRTLCSPTMHQNREHASRQMGVRSRALGLWPAVVPRAMLAGLEPESAGVSPGGCATLFPLAT